MRKFCCAARLLFNALVRAHQDSGRECNAERLGGLHVDDQFDPRAASIVGGRRGEASICAPQADMAKPILQPNLNRLWNELRSHFGSSVAALLLPPRNHEGGEINPLGYPSMSRSKTETSRLFVPIERQPAGGTDAPDLVGNAFLKRWTDRSVGSLFTFVESQMPVGRRPHLICRRGPSLKETGDFKINNSGRRNEGVLARGESFHLGRHDWGHC